MADKDQVEVVNFFVPRKNVRPLHPSFSGPSQFSVQDDLFQEDLFPPVHSGEASQNAASWLKGETVPIKKKSLKPEAAKSVYEVSLPPLSSPILSSPFQVSVEEGGRSKMVDDHKKAGKTAEEIDKALRQVEVEAIQAAIPLTEGVLELLQKGWFWDTWIEHYVTIKSKVPSPSLPLRPILSLGRVLLPQQGCCCSLPCDALRRSEGGRRELRREAPVLSQEGGQHRPRLPGQGRG